MHELLSLSLEMQEDADEIKNLLHYEVDTMKTTPNEYYTYSKEVLDVFNGNSRYVNATEMGENGKTAKYWMYYISMMHLYHNFPKAYVKVILILMYIVCHDYQPIVCI